jgi:hypothetical protein
MRNFAAATFVVCVACTGGSAISAESPAPGPAGGAAPAKLAAPAPSSSDIQNHNPSISGEGRIDPVDFFQRLVARYRGLYLYRDVATVTHVTRRDGRESNRLQTQITCEVADGKLTVKTPASQARKGLGVELPVKQSQQSADAKRNYDLWLAPHMALKFTDEPLKNLRAGVDEGFIATEAESVTIDNKQMVHVELRSGCTGDGAGEQCAAKVDLYVNSESMLIERIDTEQKLPNGADYSATLHITPEQAERESPASQPAEMPALPPTG